MSIRGYCDACQHKEVYHGDRALGGICSQGHYPMDCRCAGYINELDG